MFRRGLGARSYSVPVVLGLSRLREGSGGGPAGAAGAACVVEETEGEFWLRLDAVTGVGDEL
jgi:hypothetical protein